MIEEKKKIAIELQKKICNLCWKEVKKWEIINNAPICKECANKLK